MNYSMTFEEQTEQIVEALFATLYIKKPRLEGRCLELHAVKKVCEQGPGLVKEETQNRRLAADSASSFDPVGIAKLLRSLGDQYNAEIEGQVQAVIAEESRKKVEKFKEIATFLSRHWMSQTPGLEPERAFLAVGVKLFEKLIQKTHGDMGQINILTETINSTPEVRGYIERQGGWGNLE